MRSRPQPIFTASSICMTMLEAKRTPPLQSCDLYTAMWVANFEICTQFEADFEGLASFQNLPQCFQCLYPIINLQRIYMYNMLLNKLYIKVEFYAVVIRTQLISCSVLSLSITSCHKQYMCQTLPHRVQQVQYALP